MSPLERQTARSNSVFGMKLFNAIKTTNTYSNMMRLASSCRQIEGLATNEVFLAQVMFAVNSRNPAPFAPGENISIPSRVKSGKMKPNESATVVRQDVLVEGGRAAWFLEQLLNCELPEVTGESSEDDYNDTVVDIHYCVRESLLPPETPKSVADFTPEQKRLLTIREDSNEVIFWKLSKTEDAAVRRLVAANRNAPLHVLSKLSRDKDPETKQLALENLKVTRSIAK